MASLSLQHITKRYPNGFEAVKDFNLEIADKEFIIFVGPSGCGKSTTLRMIAGLEEISDGTLKIDDKVVNDVEPKDRDIAMVFQNYALYPHMTVYDNMAFGLKLRKVPKDQIDKMVKEAEANKEEDNKRKEEAEVKNEAEQMIFQTEKSMKDLGEKLDSKDKEEAESKVKTLKEALDKNDIEAIKKEKDALQETLYKLAAKVYENTNTTNETSEEEVKESPKDDSVKDAEFEEK